MSPMGEIAGIISCLCVASLVVMLAIRVCALKRHRDGLATRVLDLLQRLGEMEAFLDGQNRENVLLKRDLQEARSSGNSLLNDKCALIRSFDDVTALSKKALAALEGIARAARVKVPHCRLPEVIAEIVAERDRFAADSEVQRAKVTELGQQLALQSATKVSYTYTSPARVRSHKRKA